MFCFVQASVVFYELHIGFGKTGDLISMSEIEPMEKVGSMNRITCYGSIYLTFHITGCLC